MTAPAPAPLTPLASDLLFWLQGAPGGASSGWLAEKTGRTTRQVYRALTALRARELVTIESTRGGALWKSTGHACTALDTSE